MRYAEAERFDSRAAAAPASKNEAQWRAARLETTIFQARKLEQARDQ